MTVALVAAVAAGYVEGVLDGLVATLTGAAAAAAHGGKASVGPGSQVTLTLASGEQ